MSPDRLVALVERFGSLRFRRLGREVGWIVAGNVVAVLGALVGVRVLTGLLDPDAYGELALGLTFAMLVSQVLTGPLTNGAIRFYAPANEKSDLPAYLHAVRALAAQAVMLVAVITLCLTITLIVGDHSKWVLIVVSAMIFAVITGLSSVLSGIQSAARQRSVVAIHQAMESIGKFSIAAGIILVAGAVSTNAMWGYSAAAGLVLLSQYWFFFRRSISADADIQRDNRWIPEIRAYSWPFAAWGLFTWAQQASDRWALQMFGTTEQVGMYAVLFQIGYYPVATATGVMVQFLWPIFFEKAGDATDASRNLHVAFFGYRLERAVIAITVLAFLGAWLLHRQIFALFVGDGYGEVSGLMAWMVLAGGIFAAGQIVSLNQMARMKTRDIAVIKICTALVGMALNFLGAFWFGIHGVVGANVLFSFAYYIWIRINKTRVAS